MAILYNLTVPSEGSRSRPNPNNNRLAKEAAPYNQLDVSRCIPESFNETSRNQPAPVGSQSLSTPPESPTRLRPARMDMQHVNAPSYAVTPPATPTSPAHFRSSSISNDQGTHISIARQGSTASTASVPRSPSIHSHPVPLQLFDHEVLEYVVLVDDEHKKRPIGSGVWSDVYLAKPSEPKSVDESHLMLPAAVKSPPATPIKSNDSAIGLFASPKVPELYAIKAPASTSSRKVLREEAKILSYLSQFPDSDNHIVKFFGQDLRNEALVLRAMDGTLEDWIKKHLNNLDDGLRRKKLATIFPRVALSLIDSLLWMQNKNCVHADIKPSNILISEDPEDPTSVPATVYSDFSSTILVAPEIEVHNASPLGAGTWDYLDPSLLRSIDAPEASAATDLWSLAITLLFLIVGASPFDSFKHNKYQQREMIKSGQPLQCLAYDDTGIKNMRRMKDLSGALGLDLHKWFAKVLVKDVSKRINVAEWRDELARATTKVETMI